MGGFHRVLFLVTLTLAVAITGCTIPGTPPQGKDQGALLPISPTPTATPVPTPTPVPAASATPAPTLAAANTPGVSSGDDYAHTYTWEYKNVDWTFNAVVQKAKYDLFKAKPHSQEISFSSYAMASEDRDLIGSAVTQIRQGGAGYGFTRYDDAMNLVTFVQSIPYVDDHPTGSPRYPLETLADAQGDCKDKTVLLAALLHEMGFDVALLKFSSPSGHLAVGINLEAGGVSYPYGDARYFYVETTSTGWSIGEVPQELNGAMPSIIPVVKNPELQITVSATATDMIANLVDYRVQYSVTNQGPGTAKHLLLKVRAMALSHGDNVIWAPEQTIELGDLAEGLTISADTLVTIPAGEPSRVVGIVSGYNADPATDSTSDFVAS